MIKIDVSYKRTLFIILLIALNIIGAMLISIIFLGSSNGNGEGGALETELNWFMRMFGYAISVSIFISVIGLLLTRAFKSVLPVSKIYIRRIFWFELALLLLIFFIPYVYIYHMK